MTPRGIVRVAVCVAGLLLGPPAPGLAETDASTELALELPRRDRPRRVVRELLGRNRLRTLNLARYRIEMHRLDLTPDLEDDRMALDDAKDVLMSSFLRVSRERLERYLLLEERYDALRGRHRGRELARGDHGGVRLRVSPRAYRVDGSTLVGAKLRLRGLRSPIWSRAGLGVTHGLSGNNLRLRFTAEEGQWAMFLAYNSNRKKRGESAELGLSFSF